MRLQIPFLTNQRKCPEYQCALNFIFSILISVIAESAIRF